MELQKFVPEGWNDVREELDLETLKQAKLEGKVLQGFVEKCDENCNLQIPLGKNIIGIIPRNEMDALNSDEYGMTRPSICQNKVNNFVQFKIKEMYDENKFLLSRKDAGMSALEWAKNDLEPGMVVNRNG